jgi:hypothetical protein
MMRLRAGFIALVALAAIGSSGLSASVVVAADPAACDPAAAPGLTWSAPAFLAWGRSDRIGADIATAAGGLGYANGSVAVSVDGGGETAAPDAVDHDLEFLLAAPARGAAIHAAATWAQADPAGTATCTQSAALTIPLGAGRILRFKPKALKNGGIAWTAQGAGDCHDVALQSISLTVRQGGSTRRVSAADQCDPAGTRHAATRNWQLVLKQGSFELHALPAHSSLTTRLRFALRVGQRRVAAGWVSLVRTYQPAQQIVVANPSFQGVCVHGIYRVHWIGSTIGCDVPAVASVTLKLV